MVGISAGAVAAIIAASFWALLVLFLALVMVNLFRLLESLKLLLDGIREETVPMLGELRVTVRTVNAQLENVDSVMRSAGGVAKSADRISTVVEHTVSSPLIKVAAFAAGASRALRRLRKD